MNIVFLDRSTFSPEVRFPTDTVGDCHWQDHPFTRADEVVTRVRDADIVLSNKIRITAEHLANLPRLRLIAATATGVDHVDVDAARAPAALAYATCAGTPCALCRNMCSHSCWRCAEVCLRIVTMYTRGIGRRSRFSVC